MLRDRKPYGHGKTAVLLLISMLLLSGCSQPQQSEEALQARIPTAPEVTYQTVTAERGTFVRTEDDRLSIVYTKVEELSWNQGNARYEDVLVRKNQEVKAGDILMTFKVEVSEAELEASRLRLQRAREDLESGIASREQEIRELEETTRYWGYYDRTIALLKIEKLQVAYEQFIYQTQREIRQLEQKIADIEAEMENTALRAPFDGIVSYVTDWKYGGKVPAGQVLITVYSPDEFLLHCDKNMNLGYNMPVAVETNISDETITGRIIAASNILPSSLQKSGATIRLDEKIPVKELGRIITLSCQTQTMQNALLVDSSAVKRDGSMYYVYVLEDNMPRKRYVEVGANSSDMAWIIDGLYEGAVVITDLEG